MNRHYLSHQSRMKKIVNTTILFGSIILIKYFQIQIIGIENLDQHLSKKIEYTMDVKGDRGKIYDRNGILLAGNIIKVDFWVNTQKEFDNEAISSFFKEQMSVTSESNSSVFKKKL